MFQILKNAWKTPELKKKILYTLLLLLIFRIGTIIPLPGVNADYIGQIVEQFGVLGFMDIISGGSLKNFTLFATGISPYINASIIMNLLTVAIPALERLAKEGETGRKKINKITVYLTIALAFLQGLGLVIALGPQAVIDQSFLNYLQIGFCVAAGSSICVWLGEKITERGIGNGISLLIFIGIVSRLPVAINHLLQMISLGTLAWYLFIVILVIAIAIIAGVVFIDKGERRIQVQYAKRVVGRKMYGGQSTHIPMKVNSAGVLPIIFASILLQFPGVFAQFSPNSSFALWYKAVLGPGAWLHLVLMAVLIIFFTFFYTTIQFNPIEVSKNMQQYGGFIPGIRPGKPTSDYLARISMRITMCGAIFLAFISVVPTAFTGLFNLGSGAAFGATSVLILVSVSLETTRQMESQMMMRHYKGFLS